MTAVQTLENRLKALDFWGHLAVYQGDTPLYEVARGPADLSENRLIDPNTSFAIASGTKFFTALAIGKLIDQGHFSLETPAAHIFALECDQYDHRMTIGQLLSHTSGLPDYLDEDLEDENGEIQLPIPNPLLVNPADYLPMFPQKPQEFEPGTQFKYNNGAYIYLALIIEKVSGLSYQNYINTQLLQPLGLTRSGVWSITQLPKNTAHGYYQGSRAGGESASSPSSWHWNVFKTPPQAGGDGGIYTTAKDMLALWEAFFSGRILSPDLVKRFTTPVCAVDKGRDLYYGYGLWLKGASGVPYIVGSDVGVSFKSSYDPISKRFVYAVSNTSDGIWDLLEPLDQVE